MKSALIEGFATATEIADWLAAHGVPFREAHHVAGRLAKRCVDEEKTLPELTLAEYRSEHPSFDETIFDAIRDETAIERRDVLGGPARDQVSRQIAGLGERLAARGVDVQLEASAQGALTGVA